MALAAAMGLSQGTISSARMKKAIPSKWLLKISSKGVSVDWVLYGVGPMMRKDIPEVGQEGRPSDAIDEHWLAQAVELIETLLHNVGGP